VLRLATFSSASGKANLSVGVDEYGNPAIVQHYDLCAACFVDQWSPAHFDFRGTTLTVKAARAAFASARKTVAAAREAGTLYQLLLKDEVEDD
jgi:hypothetical protein